MGRCSGCRMISKPEDRHEARKGSGNNVPRRGFRGEAPNVPQPFVHTCYPHASDSPLSPKAVYGGESASLRRAPRSPSPAYSPKTRACQMHSEPSIKQLFQSTLGFTRLGHCPDAPITLSVQRKKPSGSEAPPDGSWHIAVEAATPFVPCRDFHAGPGPSYSPPKEGSGTRFPRPFLFLCMGRMRVTFPARAGAGSRSPSRGCRSA